eukprot:2013435-Amphidinium_carterae.1
MWVKKQDKFGNDDVGQKRDQVGQKQDSRNIWITASQKQNINEVDLSIYKCSSGGRVRPNICTPCGFTHFLLLFFEVGSPMVRVNTGRCLHVVLAEGQTREDKRRVEAIAKTIPTKTEVHWSKVERRKNTQSDLHLPGDYFLDN